jgi:hypothetical protein
LGRELVVNRILLRLRAFTDTGDLLHADGIFTGGFESHTSFGPQDRPADHGMFDRELDKIDDIMVQFLLDLHSMKAQLVRVKGAATSWAALKDNELQDIHGKIDVLVARLQLK